MSVPPWPALKVTRSSPLSSPMTTTRKVCPSRVRVVDLVDAPFDGDPVSREQSVDRDHRRRRLGVLVGFDTLLIVFADACLHLLHFAGEAFLEHVGERLPDP